MHPHPISHACMQFLDLSICSDRFKKSDKFKYKFNNEEFSFNINYLSIDTFKICRDV